MLASKVLTLCDSSITLLFSNSVPTFVFSRNVRCIAKTIYWWCVSVHMCACNFMFIYVFSLSLYINKILNVALEHFFYSTQIK
jgi:hypothetical protein